MPNRTNMDRDKRAKFYLTYKLHPCIPWHVTKETTLIHFTNTLKPWHVTKEMTLIHFTNTLKQSSLLTANIWHCAYHLSTESHTANILFLTFPQHSGTHFQTRLYSPSQPLPSLKTPFPNMTLVGMCARVCATNKLHMLDSTHLVLVYFVLIVTVVGNCKVRWTLT